MKWWLYNVLFTCGYVVMMPSFLRRMWKRGGYRADFGQRFGRYQPETLQTLSSRRRIWVHAVSVGEAFVAGKLVEELKRQRPGVSIVLSTTSSTGHAVCRTLLGADDVLIYFPADFPRVVRRALDAVKPLALVLTESELWPNMLRECSRRGIPTVLVNGRVSDRSFPRYRSGRYFFASVLRTFRKLLVQFDQDRDRLVAVGADPAAVQVMGTVKFDVAPPSAELVEKVRSGLQSAGIGPEHMVLLGASTWPGEESVLLSAYRSLRVRHADLRLVLVPRHMERGGEVEATIEAAGFRCLRRSRMLRNPEQGRGDVAADPRDAVLLADTTGELFGFCAAADLVFVGKTLSPHVGGQNMIEPAALGKPVVVGPHTENFTGVMAVLRSTEAIREIAVAEELEGVLEEWLARPDQREALGLTATATVQAQAGALARSATAVLECI